MKKIVILIVLFVCAGNFALLPRLSCGAEEDDWRYRNHEDQFKAPALRDYDGDGIPNRRDWRDDNDHRPGPGHYEDESEYGADPISALILRPLGMYLEHQQNKEIARRGLETHEEDLRLKKAAHEAKYGRDVTDFARSGLGVERPGYIANLPGGRTGFAVPETRHIPGLEERAMRVLEARAESLRGQESRAAAKAEYKAKTRGPTERIYSQEKYDNMIGFMEEQGLGEVLYASYPLLRIAQAGIGKNTEYQIYTKMKTLLSTKNKPIFMKNLLNAQEKTQDPAKKQIIGNMIRSVADDTYLKEFMSESWQHDQ